MDFIIYGAGRKGKAYLQFLRKYGLEKNVRYFCDIHANEIKKIEDIDVISYQKSIELNLPFMIAVKKESSKEIIEKMRDDNRKYYEGLDKFVVDELHLMDRTTYEREFCAISHLDTMNDYFDIADTESGLNFFWSHEATCYKLFNMLDLDMVVELACGRGRHVPKYIKKAGHITLVDILEKNIEICKKRFSKYDNITYIVNNGYDLAQLENDKYTSLFTYDSMVHFEVLDIAKYLSETYRILKRGGMALFHHSNNYADYKASYADAVESRSFMSDRVFAYLAYRAGLEVIEQHLMEWNGHHDLDCLTLVVKK